MSNSKTILITGCSSGFGLLTAARLAARKFRVIATMRNINKQSALLNEVAKRGGEIDLIPLDVTDKNSIKSAFDHVAVKYGSLDVLINNAGFGMAGFFEDLSEEDIRAQFETNFFGVQNVTRTAIPLMRLRKHAKIINISSVAGFSASPCFSAYNASKWALEAFSESLRYELEEFDIDVLLVQPGSYPTAIFFDNAQRAKNFDNPESPYYATSQYLKNKVQDYVKNLKNKDPEEVARLIEKLIDQKRPSFRNIPDTTSKFQFFLRRNLSFATYSWLVRKLYRKSLSQKQ